MIEFAKNEQIAALKAELDKTLRNNQTLQVIMAQYEKEIQRRKDALECNKNSPLKRNHTYQLGVGGSPSPKRQTVIFDGDGRRISPEKANPLQIVDMHGEGKAMSIIK